MVVYPFWAKYSVGFSLAITITKSPPQAPKLFIVPRKSGNRDSLIVGVSNEIYEKETHSPAISTSWEQLFPNEIVEEKCDYYSYALVSKVIKE